MLFGAAVASPVLAALPAPKRPYGLFNPRENLAAMWGRFGQCNCEACRNYRSLPKIGDTIRVRIPTRFIVRDGQSFRAVDFHVRAEFDEVPVVNAPMSSGLNMVLDGVSDEAKLTAFTPPSST
jgi:hypothetical protein